MEPGTDAELADSTSREAIELALDAGRMGVFSWDAVNDVVSWDSRLRALFGVEDGAFGGRYADWIASLHVDDRDRATAIVADAMRTGAAYDFEHRVVDRDGTVRWLEGRGMPIVRDGTVVGVRGVTVDITARKRTELELAAAQRRLALLVQVSEALGSTLELDGALDRLGGVLVPEVADFLEVAMLGSDGLLRRTLVVAPDMGWAARRREADVPLQTEHPYARAVREATVLRYDRDAQPDQFGPEGVATTAAAAGMHHAIVAPLRDPFAQGRGAKVIGVLSVGLLDGGRRFVREDEEFLAEVAYRTTAAVDRCSSYARERSVAERLQRALLPDAVPEVHGTRIAVRYRPSSAGVEVGGDWYDVVSTPSGAWVSVGDVVGRGVEAAAFMGRARAMLQALTIGEDRPGPVLERFDAAIAAMPDDPFATVVLAHLRPAERSVVLALAGHPPPLVVAPDGTTTFVGRPQAPIGTSVARRYLAEEIPLAPGSTLVLYTDGLIERAGEIIDVGLARLADAARPWAGSGDVEPMADDLLARLDVAGSDDDVAVVIVWLDPEGDR